MLLDADGLRITEAGRTRMLGELASTGLTALAKRYDLEAADLDWQETPEPEGYNNNRFAAYQLIVSGVDDRPALLSDRAIGPERRGDRLIGAAGPETDGKRLRLHGGGDGPALIC